MSIPFHLRLVPNNQSSPPTTPASTFITELSRHCYMSENINNSGMGSITADKPCLVEIREERCKMVAAEVRLP